MVGVTVGGIFSTKDVTLGTTLGVCCGAKEPPPLKFLNTNQPPTTMIKINTPAMPARMPICIRVIPRIFCSSSIGPLPSVEIWVNLTLASGLLTVLTS